MTGLDVLLILAGAAGIYVWNLSKAANNLTYFPGNITGISLDGLTPVVFATLIIQNTSNLSFTISSLAGSVTSNGTLIGNVSDFIPVAIPANSQGQIPLTLRMQPLGLVNDIIAILTGGNGTRTLVVAGSVNANGIQQPFSLTYNVGV